MASPLQLAQDLYVELRRVRELLEELLRTSRYNRGGYDGPWLSASRYAVSGAETVRVFPGRGEPSALVISWEGTGNADENLYVGTDPGQVMSGFIASLTTTGQLRLIVEEHDNLYARTDGAAVTLRVVHGKL